MLFKCSPITNRWTVWYVIWSSNIVIYSYIAKCSVYFTFLVGPIHRCSKIDTVEALAEFQQMYPQIGQDCLGQRSASHLITTDLCGFNVTSQSWRPGSKVHTLSYKTNLFLEKKCQTIQINLLSQFHCFISCIFITIKR